MVSYNHTGPVPSFRQLLGAHVIPCIKHAVCTNPLSQASRQRVMEPVAIETGDADRFQNDEPYNDVEEPRKVIMALDIGNDEVMGCAFFDSVDGSLNIAEDIPHSSSDVSQHFAIHANPTLLLASSRAPLNFLASLERCTVN